MFSNRVRYCVGLWLLGGVKVVVEEKMQKRKMGEEKSRIVNNREVN